MYRGVGIALVLLFLSSVARFYHPGLGFTALLGLPDGHDREAPALRAVPHYDYPAWAAYDGQFYVQRALDPLLRDPQTDAAMDLAPFRARRILFSWTAYVLGLGRPAWIVEAYALQNVGAWLLLALLLTRWIPLTSWRGVAVWAACLFSHGLLWSVRFALLDGPSLLLIACAVAAVERGRPLLSSAVIGIAALGRETNLLAAVTQPIPRDRRGWLRLGVALLLIAVPIALWYDYLRSIYRGTLFVGTDQLVLPGAGLWEIWTMAIIRVQEDVGSPTRWLAVALLLSLGVQAAYLAIRRDYQSPWWRIAIAYAVLMLVLDRTLANPATGAITRVLLPMTVGFNIALLGERRPGRFWAWFAAGNLHLLSADRAMPLF